jgi:hypothetical protein
VLRALGVWGERALDTTSRHGVRDTTVEGRSANHFEMAFTESEFLVDFGQSYGDSESALIHTRVILTPRSAKTLSLMLQELVQQYEQSVGPIGERKA